MKTFLQSVLAGLLLSGCALPPLEESGISKVTHADLIAAATYAEKNGYTARGAVWRAIDAQLSQCEKAIDSAIPRAPDVPSGAGVFTALEIAAEAAGSAGALPATVKINCAPFPVVTFPLGLIR